ncbi:lipopolysaccharide-induced tumor necrosis factor-alpha factor homolog [Rhinatrema bivittatum]|uniref:lipopolysaccharide-induced tumor necrosis factor-alpha factor homolog n=1 Tax=Rhinatrema bivittatum TaxID=194408 RepID=UPI00112D650C|nr:lipopolysaccharide-induced tumor necrosis factor-alpha factor homolog [Rhinatrema bivittatum]
MMNRNTTQSTETHASSFPPYPSSIISVHPPPQDGAGTYYPTAPPHPFMIAPEPSTGTAYPSPPPNTNQKGQYAQPVPQLQPAAAGAIYPPPPPYTNQNGSSVLLGPQLQPAAVGAVYPLPPPYTSQNGPNITPTSVIVTSVPATPVVLGSGCLNTPASTICPSCHCQVITRITHSAGLLAWLICLILILFGCWLGCCLIPFCIESCLDVNHFCPNCNFLIHKHKHL